MEKRKRTRKEKSRGRKEKIRRRPQKENPLTTRRRKTLQKRASRRVQIPQRNGKTKRKVTYGDGKKEAKTTSFELRAERENIQKRGRIIHKEASENCG